MKNSKKAESLSFETIVVSIIVLVVIAVIILFIYKYGGSLFGFLGDRVDSAVSGAKDVKLPQP